MTLFLPVSFPAMLRCWWAPISCVSDDSCGHQPAVTVSPLPLQAERQERGLLRLLSGHFTCLISSLNPAHTSVSSHFFKCCPCHSSARNACVLPGPRMIQCPSPFGAGSAYLLLHNKPPST